MSILSESKGSELSDSESITAVILAAGRGLRAQPATLNSPKALLEVGGVSLLERNLQLIATLPKVKEVYIVIGYLGEMIKEEIGYCYSGLGISYINQSKQKGAADALLLLEAHLKTKYFFTLLADEFYENTLHSKLVNEWFNKPLTSAIFYREEKNVRKISANYSMLLDEQSRVTSVCEKPKIPISKIMGVGSYLFSNSIFQAINSTAKSPFSGEIELTDAISTLTINENVMALDCSGKYFNVNTTEELNLANYLVRESNFDSALVSVVIPAYNEEVSLPGVIAEFSAHKDVYEVVVVDNNSADKTYEVASFCGAKVVKELAQGYGCAIRKGIKSSAGDIVIIIEADGSFSSNDIGKFLEYLKDSDLAVGTRTTRQMLEQGANMSPLARLINIIFGKIIEILWWEQEPRFTDVGCTYRALWRASYDKIEHLADSAGPEYSPDMMIAFLQARLRVIELPVTYRRRFSGESQHSGSFFSLFKTAYKMLVVIIKKRFSKPRHNVKSRVVKVYVTNINYYLIN